MVCIGDAVRAGRGVKRLGRRLLLMAPLLAPGAAFAAKELNLQPPVTPIASQIFDLHLLITGVCAVIFVVVFSVMFYSIFAHRKSKGHKAAQFHENTTVEVIWTVIPFLILLAMAFPATKTILAMKDTSAPDITVKVTGFQWKWQYDYLDHGFSFVSNLATPQSQIRNQDPKGDHYLLDVDEAMVVPTGKKVRVLITAGDVIHSWWVPAFGVKQDAIPGFVRDSWFKADTPGIYRGQCAELCGKEHGFMPVVVEVKTPEAYAQWVDAQKKKAAASCRGSEQGLGPEGPGRARRESLYGQLRRLSSGERQGRAARVSAPRRVQDRNRSRGGAPRHRVERRLQERSTDGDGGVEEHALEHRHRRRRDVRAQRVGQPYG